MAFFGVGALKSRFVDQPWWRSGAETFALGGSAAILAFSIGTALGGITT
jgi:VIT1/CCC1 family predicted Fe2+/Mn2+ transporter